MISLKGQRPMKRGREDDDNEPPQKKRKGNNPSGAKGLFKCERCRRQKQKCDFPEDEPGRPCALCSRNLLPCGPKVSTRTTQSSPTAGRDSREIQSSSRPSVPNTGAVPNSFDPNRNQIPPGLLGTQTPLSRIVVSIENQYPNATLEEHYRLTGLHLQALRSSQNAPTQTPQPQFTTIDVQSGLQDHGRGVSQSNLSRTLHEDTMLSFPPSVDEAGGTQQPQLRPPSHPVFVDYQSHFQGSLHPVSGSTYEPLVPFNFPAESHSGERASTPTRSEDRLDGDDVPLGLDAPSPRTPRMGFHGLQFSSPAGSYGEREIRSSQSDPPPNPLPLAQVPYPPSPPLFQGGRQTQRHLQYRTMQQGPSYSEVDPFRRPINLRSPPSAEDTTSSRRSPNSNHNIPRPIHPTAPTPNPLGSPDLEIEVVDATPPSEPTLEDMTILPTPVITRGNVTWSEEWPMNAPLRPGRFPGGEEGRMSTTVRHDRDDLPTMTSNSSSNSEQSSHVTGHGDPMERFYGIEESE